MNQTTVNHQSLRLLAEILLIIGVSEATVMLLLPTIAPGVSEVIATVLDVGLLTLLAAPVLLWRFIRLTQKSQMTEPGMVPLHGIRAWVFPLLALLFGFALSLGVAYETQLRIQLDAKARFEQQVNRLEQNIVRRFERPLHGLKSLSGLFNARKSVERAEFQNFWELRSIAEEFPGIRGFGFIAPVIRKDLASFSKAARLDGAPDFLVKTQGHYPDLYVVKYLKTTSSNRLVEGMDFGSELVRRSAILKAIATGQPVLSGTIPLVQQDGKTRPGFIYLLPLFRHGAKPDTEAQRKAAMVGLVYSGIVMDEIMAAAINSTQDLVDFELFDGLDASADKIIFNSKASTTKAQFVALRKLTIGSHPMTLGVRSSSTFEASVDASRPALIGIFGLLLTLFVTLTLWLMIKGRAMAEERARLMSADLARLAKVAQVTNNSVIIANDMNQIEWVNGAFTRISGFSLQESIGQNPSALRKTDVTDPMSVVLIRQALVKGEDVRIQTRNCTPAGRDYWLDVDIQVVRTDDGAYAGFVAVETDITAEKAVSDTLKAALRETTALMNTINAHGIVSEADNLGQIVNVNYAFMEISGYSREELVGSHHRIVNSGVHPPGFWAEMWATIASGKPWRGQICNRAKNGTLYWVDSLVAPFVNENGQIVKYVSIRTDITAAKNYEQSLKDARHKAEEATRSKGRFLANMSHELRTPMNAILGMLSLLQKTELTPRQSDYASKSEGAAQSLLVLLNDILDFSKVEAGKMTLDPQPFRLDHLMRDLSVVLAANVISRQTEVLFDIDPAIPSVLLGDAMRLKQVLINLGGNAIKFTKQGQVVVTVRLQSQDVPQVSRDVRIEFVVEDSGIGIAVEHQTHIFSGFSQAEASTTRRFGGTGLGLAISKRLVEVLGGNLQVTSELGVGSRFAFSLALPPVTVIPEALKDRRQSSAAPRHVLVVDDNHIAADLMHQMACSLGWCADLATSGIQALQMIQAAINASPDQACPYQLIFLDWQMPGMDGWETARQIRQLSCVSAGRAPLLIMVTGHGRETMAQRTQDEQDMLSGFLVKPVTASMMLDAVMDTDVEDAKRRQVQHRGSSQRRLNGMRLLVVEDNLINQQVAEELLNLEGALVSLAANGQLGLEAVAAAYPQFDAVLMDIQMPVMDGYAATQAIRQQLGLGDLPIIAMTANAMVSDREACLAAGMNEHVGKPFNLTHLVAVLLRLTGRTAAADHAGGAVA